MEELEVRADGTGLFSEIMKVKFIPVSGGESRENTRGSEAGIECVFPIYVLLFITFIEKLKEKIKSPTILSPSQNC